MSGREAIGERQSSKAGATSQRDDGKTDALAREGGLAGWVASMADTLDERRERHLRRNRVYRIGVAVLGFVLVLIGVVMTGPVPGPGFLIIPIGLALLALEFGWAERLLERTLAYAARASKSASEQSTARKVAAAIIFALAVAAAVTAAILWDIPVLPV